MKEATVKQLRLLDISRMLATLTSEVDIFPSMKLFTKTRFTTFFDRIMSVRFARFKTQTYDDLQ